ncbi:MAG: hypothetical protein SH868_03370 [Bythopirellula sp.]|nr:hypothetical protein [Bythopirellula sp.]
MDLWEKMFATRYGYDVHSGTKSRSFESPESLACEFGLKSHPNIYIEFDLEVACKILCTLLHQDMAYKSELIPLAEAELLSNAFIELFKGQICRFYSNGEWHIPYQEWTPATDATFDGGILALGEHLSGCVWFEDED